MSLDNGHYIITSPSFGGRPVGRSPIEDLSLLPKQVYVLPDGVTAPKVSSIVILVGKTPISCLTCRLLLRKAEVDTRSRLSTLPQENIEAMFVLCSSKK